MGEADVLRLFSCEVTFRCHVEEKRRMILSAYLPIYLQYTLTQNMNTLIEKNKSSAANSPTHRQRPGLI